MFSIRRLLLRPSGRNLSTMKKNQSILISASQAALELGDPNVKFIDVRDKGYYRTEHIPGAINVREFFTYLAMSSQRGKDHLARIFKELLQARGVNGNEKLITYEGDFRGMYGASCRAWYMLNLLGHTNSSVLHGGWDAWIADNHPTETGEEVLPQMRGVFEPQWNSELWADLNEVVEIIKTGGDRSAGPETKLLDVRDLPEWKGLSSSPYGVDYTPRKGRLPGAFHLEWYDLMETKPNGVTYFKPPDEIRKLAWEKGIKPEDDVVIYCFKGARASNSLLALQTAGFYNIRNYFASWNEWSRVEELVIDDEKLSEKKEYSQVTWASL